MKIEKNHEITGKTLDEIRGVELGSYYPVLDSDNHTIIGVFSAEFGTPVGYFLDHDLQAFVEVKR